MFLRRDQASAARAKRTAAIPALHPELEEFLYSSIGEAHEETASSVLSALARQNLDPWEEAAHLAQMPRESAVLRLTSLITSGTGPPAPSVPATAARLVALLPQPDGFGLPSLSRWRDEGPRYIPPIVTYLIVGAIILASALLGS